jgi:hypothetical protein
LQPIQKITIETQMVPFTAVQNSLLGAVIVRPEKRYAEFSRSIKIGDQRLLGSTAAEV